MKKPIFFHRYWAAAEEARRIARASAWVGLDALHFWCHDKKAMPFTIPAIQALLSSHEASVKTRTSSILAFSIRNSAFSWSILFLWATEHDGSTDIKAKVSAIKLCVPDICVWYYKLTDLIWHERLRCAVCIGREVWNLDFEESIFQST